MVMPKYTALVALLALLVYFWLGLNVARARGKYNIKAPAITGNPDFERVLRVQMNTLEWMPIFLPALWLAAVFSSDVVAATLGLVWIAGRLLYMRGYTQAAARRKTGFFVQASAAGILWTMALIGVINSVIHA
jgi:glutathione S-transferase